VADRADRDANQALRARFDDVFGQYQRLRSGMDDIQRRLAEMQVSAESPDGLVRATVGARGQLVDLKLDRRAYRDLDPEQLGRVIVATVQQAGARTTEQVRDLMSAYLPPDSGAMRFVRDQDFGSLLRRPDEIMRDAAGERDE
jgi:DNA-binding protein YbaB